MARGSAQHQPRDPELAAALQGWAETSAAAVGLAGLAVYLQRGDQPPELVAGVGSVGSARRLVPAIDNGTRRDRHWWLPRAPTGDQPRRYEVRDPSGKVLAHLSLLAVWANPGAPPNQELIDVLAAHAVLVVENAELLAQLNSDKQALQAGRDEVRTYELAFDTAFEESVTGMAMVSLEPATAGAFLRVNDALRRLTGYGGTELNARSFSDITHPDDRGLDESALRRALAGRRTPFRMDKRYLRADGSPIWVRVTANPIFDDDGTPRYALTQVEDLSERQDHETELAANRDTLTELLNPTAFDDTLTVVIDRARRRGTPGGLYVTEIAGWAEIAAEHGQAVSDQVQQRTAQRLRDVLRGDDPICRLGDNEFAFFAEDLSRKDAENLARRINAALAQPEIIDGHEIQLRAHLGVVELTELTGDAGILLHQARTAMKAARTATDGTHVLYARAADPAAGVPSSQILYLNPDWDETRA